MFSNQLSAKELYSTNPSQFLQRSGFRSHQEDSAFNSSQTMSQANSQIMSSQMENSQSSSFDMFSQMMMSQQQGLSQQTENSNNPQRFYQKYMSKAPLFNKEPDRNPLPRKRSFQDQLESNKQRAKERDDRDLINTFINLVRECTEEVKSAASDIRKDVDKSISKSASQFGSLIQKINEDLKNYHHTLLDAMKAREDQRATVEEMQRDIAARDSKIEVLEMQLDAARQERDERVVRSLLEAYAEQQKMNREQMDKMQTDQQAFCKTQMKRLQEEQERYILRCAAEKEAAKAAEASAAANGRDSHGGRPAGPKQYAPVIDLDNRPQSWNGLPQYEHGGCRTQPMSDYQENLNYQNRLIQTHSNTSIAHHSDVTVAPVINPTSAPFSNGGNSILLPTTSVGWAAPLAVQSREQYLQSSNCHNPGYSHNQSAVNQQAGTNIPNLLIRNSRPSGFTLQPGYQAVPPMASPTGSSNTSGRWNTNKLKPSPVAAVAPQVKPKETVHPTQGQNNHEIREAPRNETPQSATTRRKKGRQRYEVAVKTKRQSARVKAKQNSSSPEGKNEMNEENHRDDRCHGRQTTQNISSLDPRQPLKSKIVQPQQEIEDEDVYEYREPEKDKQLSNKKKVLGKQIQSGQQKSSTSKKVQKVGRNGQENQPKHRCNGRPASKVANFVQRQPVQAKSVRYLPKGTDPDVYEYTEPEKEKNSSIKKRIRGKENYRKENYRSHHNSSANELQAHQDCIFSQKQLNIYVKDQNARCDIPKMSHLGKGKQKKKATPQKCDESSTEDEEYDSQGIKEDASQDLKSQDDSDDGEYVKDAQDTQPVKRMQVLKKIKQLPMMGKPVSHPKQQQVIQLDTMLSYSDQDESSEEMIFSLKLPDSTWHQDSSPQQAKRWRQTGEQVVPVIKNTDDILSTPCIQAQDRDSDEDSTGTAYSICVSSGRKMSRQMERKRRLSHFAGSSSAAMAEITNSLRLQHPKIRRISACH